MSTASSILATTPAPAPTAAALASNDAQPFAKLIGKPASDGKAPQGEAKAKPEAGNDTEASVETKSEDVPAPANGTTEETGEKETDLLAEIEAMVAAASQLTVAPPPSATTVVPASVIKTSLLASTTAASATPAPAFVPTMPAAPAMSSAPATADATAPATAEQTDGKTADAAAPTSVMPDLPGKTDAAPAKTSPLSGDIASIIAALKSAAAAQETAPTTTEASAPIAAATPAASIDATTVATEGTAKAAPTVDTEQPATDLAMAKAATAEKPAMPTAPTTASPEVAEAVVQASAEAATAQPEAKIEAKAEAKPEAQAATDIVVGDDAPAQAAPIEIKQAAAPNANAPAAEPRLAPLPAGADQRAPIAADSRTDDRDTLISSAAPSKARRDEVAVSDDRPADAVIPAAAPFAPAATASTDDAKPVESATATLASQSVDRQLDLAKDARWLDKLAQDINQAAATQGQLKFHLNPEHLGSLLVEISNGLDGASIKLTADNDKARAIIADAQPRLIAEVRAQGLRVADAQVDLSNQQQQSNGGNAQMAGGQANGQQQRRSSEDHKPFSTTPANQREVASDSAPRDKGELYA